jgi:hypothetical protein
VIICRVRIFTLDYHNFCISIQIGKCGMIMYVQLLTRWTMIVSGVGSAHNRATHLIMFLIVLNFDSFRTHEPHQCITDNIKNTTTGYGLQLCLSISVLLLARQHCIQEMASLIPNCGVSDWVQPTSLVCSLNCHHSFDED